MFKEKITIKRQKELIEQYLTGKTQAELGRLFGISRQRVFQILSKAKVIKSGGLHLKRTKREFKYGRKFGQKDDSILYKAKRAKFIKKKADAKRRGILFDVDFADIVWPTHCPVLGLELDYYSGPDRNLYPSFDRVVPELGYTFGNVIIISYRANHLKNDANLEEIRKLFTFYDNLNQYGRAIPNEDLFIK